MRTVHWLLIVALASPLSAPPLGAAQDAPAAERSPRPRGGARNARAPAAFAGGLGFRMNPDGTSRVSVALSASVEATSTSSGRRFEVRLPRTNVRSRNDLHPLETRFFNTPVLRARLVRRGRADMALVIDLRADVAANMRIEPVQTGGFLVVVDLPAGQYVDGPPQLGGGSVTPSDTESSMGTSDPGRGNVSGADDERPPSFR